MPPKRSSQTGSKRAKKPKIKPSVSILSLPAELHLLLISHLPSRKDLKRLCLTCKSLSAVATSVLYRHVVLKLCRLRTHLERTFNEKNAGLLHVRHLTITDLHREYEDNRHGCTLTEVLRALPRDVLLSCSLETSKLVGTEVSFMLRIRQRQLTNCELHAIKTVPPIDCIPDRDELRNVTSLSLYLASRHDRQRAAAVLLAASNTQNLALTIPDDGLRKI
ncbi:hypothetical protein BAUCODRAFT_173923 [Baudoinia panamericana UAMH 10762]|uniref:F-box domain-containing protein n=1 Tax=Baudoinia panamericana (strain UAMH 10762) TaxID=717646 RepID=M2M0N5_BAUPA|nr:uncharacterized protein BAUCODRAFT_173923 [Baudoinia panamericana UAMH 10762]EMD00563.1 hypothetical protein BAUCODRAFT_173923 [Baudoinia panamericana UAMH 10762]